MPGNWQAGTTIAISPAWVARRECLNRNVQSCGPFLSRCAVVGQRIFQQPFSWKSPGGYPLPPWSKQARNLPLLHRPDRPEHHLHRLVTGLPHDGTGFARLRAPLPSQTQQGANDQTHFAASSAWEPVTADFTIKATDLRAAGCAKPSRGQSDRRRAGGFAGLELE